MPRPRYAVAGTARWARLSCGIAGLWFIAQAPAAALHAQDRDQAQAAALQRRIADVIRSAEAWTPLVLVARGDPYAHPPVAEPWRLGVFPSNAQEAAAASRNPALAPHHERFVAEHVGSGIVLERTGLVLTCHHVVERARKIYVRFSSGLGSYADIHAADPRSDLAVLRLLNPPASLEPARLGVAENLRRGHFLVGLAWSFPPTDIKDGPSCGLGILSRMSYQAAAAPGGEEAVQSTPLIATLSSDIRLPGATSGGAILNLDGEVVGLTSNLTAWRGTGQEVLAGVALDGTARRILAVLQQGAEVEYGFLGVTARTIPAEQLVGSGLTEGAAVRITEEVTAGTPAARAGMRRGDIIISLDGVRVHDVATLNRMVAAAFAGSGVEIELLRERRRQTVRPELARQGMRERGLASRRPAPFRGLHVDYLTATLGQVPPNRPDLFEKASARLRGGSVVVVAVDPGSAAERAGLRPDDVITHFNDRPLRSPIDFHREAARASGPVQLTLLPLAGDSPPRKLQVP